MTDDELRRLLVTCDGAGKDAKRAALDALLADRNEADRFAGEMHRRVVRVEESQRTQERWLRQAKAAAGYDERVSFDVVWEAALAALLASRLPTEENVST